MLKKVSKKSVLLFGVVLALCAFAMPSMASATGWHPVGTSDGTLDANGLGFVAPQLGSGSFCRVVQFEVTVHSATVATITGGAFRNCHANANTAAAGCTVTATGTNFPWIATGLSTSNIQIHNIDINVRFETTPPAGSVACANNGVDLRLTGTLGQGIGTQTLWDTGAVTRRITFNATTGLTAHVLGAGISVGTLVSGTVTTTGLLNFTD